MIIKNVWKDVREPLEIHTDDRGSIVDLFYSEDINHVATVTSAPNVIRGNHYHKETTQHMLMISGSMEYWYKKFGSDYHVCFGNGGDRTNDTTPEVDYCTENNIEMLWGIGGGKIQSSSDLLKNWEE